MGDTFYGLNPLYRIGDTVYFKASVVEKPLAEIAGIIFTRDEETGEIVVRYEIALLDEMGLILEVGEEDLEPAKVTPTLPAIAEEQPFNEVNYEEYTADELLTAYNRFKDAAQLLGKGKRKDRYFTNKMKEIKEIWMRKTAGKGNR
jgi:hypothetical protein